MGRSCHTKGIYSDSLRSREEAISYGLMEPQEEGREAWHRPLTMVPHVVTQEPLCGKSLGTVGALETLLWGGVGRTKGTEENSEGQGRGEPSQT